MLSSCVGMLCHFLGLADRPLLTSHNLDMCDTWDMQSRFYGVLMYSYYTSLIRLNEQIMILSCCSYRFVATYFNLLTFRGEEFVCYFSYFSSNVNDRFRTYMKFICFLYLTKTAYPPTCFYASNIFINQDVDIALYTPSRVITFIK